jgi:hypothetical protein
MSDRTHDLGFSMVAAVCVCMAACDSELARPSPLFAVNETRLSHDEMSAIEGAFLERFQLSDDGLHFTDENCGEIPTRTEVVDLNGDGAYEVFVYWGNTCTSGGTGSSLSMYAKDVSGHYRDLFGFPAFDYTALPTGQNGYPDLQFGGPGFCFAVWSWTGSNYEFKCNSPQEEGGCQHTGNVCQSD